MQNMVILKKFGMKYTRAKIVLQQSKGDYL